jgi:TIR domain
MLQLAAAERSSPPAAPRHDGDGGLKPAPPRCADSCDVVFSLTSIPAGQEWFDRIVDGMKDTRLHFVLCSPEAVKRPWINLETGAACMKGIEVIPICHSGLTPTQLPVPLSQFEAVQASNRAGLAKLYGAVAAKLGSAVPEGGLDTLVRDIAAFERSYEEKAAEAARCEFAPVAVGVIESPRVLCVSSKQLLREGIGDFERRFRTP